MRPTITFLLALLFLTSCREEMVTDPKLTDEELLAVQLALPEEPYSYANPSFPGYLLDLNTTREDNLPESNPITDWGATLGRVLFYDQNLSFNREVSCASCHEQARNFTDPAQFSEGFNGGLTRRHAMTLANARFYRSGRFFWDERAETLESQVLQPFFDEVEMGLDEELLLERIAEAPHYEVLYEHAFGDDEMTTERTALAIAQFIRSMLSFDAKFDRAILAMPEPVDPFFLGSFELPLLTEQENRGYLLFYNEARCQGCHQTALFVADIPTNNGLDSLFTEDTGIGEVTGEVFDIGKFKMPSLRNIAVSAPYMHDGRFETLEEVVEHYNSGVVSSPTLDLRLTGFGPQNREPRRLNLSEEDKAALVAFLHTLTDENFLADERFSDPFK